MINHDIHLRDDLFDTPAQEPTRDGFGRALLELGKTDPRVVALSADLTESTRVLAFREAFPERFVEIGVAEQNLAAVASGLARWGKIPFIASYATFSPGRNNEQIRTTISLNNVPVKVCGMHAGLQTGADGATHQALEDIALMRVQPNMTVLSPCDAEEAYKATLAAARHAGPVYLRFTREKSPVMTTPETPFVFGKAQTMWESDAPQVTVFATGPLLYEALRAAKELEREIGVLVINIHAIKPLDAEAVVAAAKATGAVVTVEEHQITGGLGSAVAECLAQKHPVPIEFIGIRDRFGQSGTPQELIKEYGLDASAIMEAVRTAYSRR